MIRLVNSSREALLNYLEKQLANFFPDQEANVKSTLNLHIDEALTRLEVCINAVKMWRVGEFDYLHSSQYAIFLYFLANTIWRNKGDIRLCTKLFYLNKTLNGIDCFYEVQMPNIFFIGHSVGVVLAKATYSNYLALYQNSTVGKNHGIAPVLGEGVVMYPNTAIIGRSKVANGSILAQGTSVINRNTIENNMVFNGEAGDLVFKPANQNILQDLFRLNS